ncbi:MAG TPA: alpha/beta fold hydrolase [Terriglobales bacterium]|nr:alpha/beta fold hydrolase [Terriglobales bacterium]
MEKETLVLPAANQPISFEDHWITLDGARMRYLRDGLGPPLLLLHGLLGYSFSWRYAIPALANNYTVHAVDMLGVGFSDRPPELDCCLHASAQRLLRFLDAAGMVSCDLLGTSHGGAVAMRAAAIAPERIHRLILVAPVNPWSLYGSRMAAFLSNPWVAPVFQRVAPFLKFAHGRLLRNLYGDPRRIRPGTLEGYSAPFSMPGAFQYGLSVLRTWQPDLRELELSLPRISHIPTLLLWGAEDNAVDPASAQRLKQEFHDCRVRMLPGVGHLPYEEVPDEFNREVAAFLESTSRAFRREGS